MGTRRLCLVTVASVLATAGRTALSQGHVARVPRVGFITGAEGPTQGTAAFVKSLEMLGHTVGRTLTIEWRYAAGRNERFREFVDELVGLRVDVLVASGPQAIVLASKATSTIPIVMAAATDPVRWGVIASLSHPGGNVTGLALDVSPTLYGKQVQILREAVPRLGRLGVLFNPDLPGVQDMLEAVRRSAQGYGIRVVEMPIRVESELEPAIQAAVGQHIEALQVIPDPSNFGFRQRIGELEAKYRLPSMHFLVEYVAAGGLMSYGPSLLEQFERCAGFVARILKGTPPSALPVELPTRYELVINGRTARALGIQFDGITLLRADRVLE